MNPKPHHIALKVLDLQRCEQFYTGVLGLQIMRRHLEQDGTIRSVWFNLGGIILMLERWEGRSAGVTAASAQQPPAGWHLLALTITPESRGEWRDRLRRAGVQITGETACSIYFCDPENNRLALSHYPEREPGV
jgi:catechol 2,3-dioxygenase-like lactoylglutathione lyase family enzyme